MSNMERSSRPNRKTSSTISTIGSLVGLSIIGGFGFLAIFSDRFDAVHFVAGVLVFGGMDFLAVKLAKKWLVEPPPDVDTTQKQSVPQHSTVASTRPRRTVTVQLDTPVSTVFDRTKPVEAVAGSEPAATTTPDTTATRPDFIAPVAQSGQGASQTTRPLSQTDPFADYKVITLSPGVRKRLKAEAPDLLKERALREIRNDKLALFFKFDKEDKHTTVWVPGIVTLLALFVCLPALYTPPENGKGLYYVLMLALIGIPAAWVAERVQNWYNNLSVVTEEHIIRIRDHLFGGVSVDHYPHDKLTSEYQVSSAPRERDIKTIRAWFAKRLKLRFAKSDTLARNDSAIWSFGPYRDGAEKVSFLNRVRDDAIKAAVLKLERVKAADRKNEELIAEQEQLR